MFHTISSIAPICESLHHEGKTIILVTGFFDLLHAEHINFLRKAKEAGDILIVAVESDVRARAIKGEGRPVETQSIRCQHLLELSTPTGSDPEGSAQPELGEGRSDPQGRIVDFVLALPDDFDNPVAFESLIEAAKPNFLAVSSHTAHQDKKQALVAKYGGNLAIVHDWNPSVSTTQIINSKNHV